VRPTQRIRGGAETDLDEATKEVDTMKCFIHRSVLLCALGLLAACSNGTPVNIGDDRVGSLGENLTDYAGSWDGYAEVFRFDDGSDRIRLMLDDDGSGVLEVGESEALPEPDPDHVYPPNAPDVPFGSWSMSGPRLDTLVSGFSYPIDGASVASRRIRIATTTQEIYREWCGRQTSYLTQDSEPDHYACQPWTVYAYTDGVCRVGWTDDSEGMEIECGKLTCLEACNCSESGCGIHEMADVQLDATLQAGGEELRGSLLIGSELINVQLTRL
jgi:hypothetical protein